MSPSRTAFDLSTCARPNILKLSPYRCARDDYKDNGTNILLDANENAYGPGLVLDKSGYLANASSTNGLIYDQDHTSRISSSDLDLRGLNRYPDPHQHELKTLLCSLRQGHSSTWPLTPDNLFVGVGSDEAIDAVIRCFCVPGRDKILICPPTYGMYTVSADVNDARVVRVPQIVESDGSFSIDVDGIEEALAHDLAMPSSEGRIKLIFLCTPGNPTGQLIPQSTIERLLNHPRYNGLILLDEAYIDFAPSDSSLAPLVTSYPNLGVMQTLSKAFGLAGIRLGACFTSPEIAQILNNVKAPYNISSITSQLACRALQKDNLQIMQDHKKSVLSQRDRLVRELPRIKGIGRFRGAYDSNFLLTEILDRPGGKPDNRVALSVYEALAAERGVVVRFRGKEHGCVGCLRITVGTETETDRFLQELEGVLGEAYRDGGVIGNVNDASEERREVEESKVVA